jgi:hypothetical protein
VLLISASVSTMGSLGRARHERCGSAPAYGPARGAVQPAERGTGPPGVERVTVLSESDQTCWAKLTRV